MSDNLSLQQKYAAKSICFGCGPANEQGLRINSFPVGDKVVANWHAQKHHQAFVGTLNGGIIGALLDCHCNWAAAYYLMKEKNLETVPCTVTAEYTIKLLKPTPTDKEIHLEAELLEIKKSSAKIAGKLMIENEVYDTCEGFFVAVKEGHPAFHRW